MDRVLVVLPNWYGETLFATPFLRTLKTQHPRAFLATLGWPQCREVLLHNPHVDDMLDYDERGTHRSLAGKWRLIQTLRRQRFDAAFILRKSLSRSLMLALAGIPARIGFANPKSGWLLTHRIPPATLPRHKADTYLPLLHAVGVTASTSAYDYVVGEDERRAARDRLSALHLLDARPLVVLHPGANWPHKQWSLERFAAVGDRVVEHHQARVLITGGPNDVAHAESIRQHMRKPSTMLAGRTTFRQLAACLEQADVVISNDTGVLHIAAALHRPLVALYGPTSPQLTGPLGNTSRIIVLHHPDCCPNIPCYTPDHPPHQGMDAITVDEVYDAACELLDGGRKKVEGGTENAPHV